MHIFTDGSCLGNPGPGGWAFEVPGLFRDSGNEIDTTNYRMELTAIIEAIKWAGKYGTDRVTIFSDSQWCINCLTGKWKAKTNSDLFQELRDISPGISMYYQWVRGHEVLNTGEAVYNKRVSEQALVRARYMEENTVPCERCGKVLVELEGICLPCADAILIEIKAKRFERGEKFLAERKIDEEE